MLRSTACTLVAALALAACDTADLPADVDDGIAVQTDRLVYALGDDVTLTLASETASGFELAAALQPGCSVELERLEGDGWSLVPLTPTPMCVASPRWVAGGESLAERFALHATEGGTYRYTVTIAVEGQRASTPPFVVR